MLKSCTRKNVGKILLIPKVCRLQSGDLLKWGDDLSTFPPQPLTFKNETVQCLLGFHEFRFIHVPRTTTFLERPLLQITEVEETLVKEILSDAPFV